MLMLAYRLCRRQAYVNIHVLICHVLQAAIERISDRLPPCLYLPMQQRRFSLFYLLSLLPHEARVFRCVCVCVCVCVFVHACVFLVFVCACHLGMFVVSP